MRRETPVVPAITTTVGSRRLAAHCRSRLPVFGFLVLSVVVTWPLVVTPASVIAGGGGDPLLVAYILNWGAWSLFHHPAGVFDASFYFPSLNTLALSENLLSVSWPLSPVALIGNPILLYNVAFFLSFFLSSWFFYRYLRRLGLAAPTAWCGAVLFGFMPWRLGQIGHAQLLFTWWIPFALERFEAWKREPTPARAAGVGLGYALAFLASVYHGFFFFPFLLVYCGVRVLSGDPGSWGAKAKRALAHGLIAGAVAGAALAPVLLAYASVPKAVRGYNTLDMVRPRGADVTDYVNAPAGSLLWSFLDRQGHPYSDVPWEMHAFPGAIPLVAFLASVPILFSRPRLFRSMPESMSVVAALAAAAASALLLSLGPTIHAGGVELARSLPYQVLFDQFSALRAIRVPARAAFYVGLSGAALAAVAMDALCSRSSGLRRRVALGCFGLLVLADTASRPIPFGRPAEYARLRHAFCATDSFVTEAGTDLVLPISDRTNYASPAASSGRFRPLVNGKSGYLLPLNASVFANLGMARPGPVQAGTMESLDVTRLLLDRRALPEDETGALLSSLRKLAKSCDLLGSYSDYDVYLLAWD